MDGQRMGRDDDVLTTDELVTLAKYCGRKTTDPFGEQRLYYEEVLLDGGPWQPDEYAPQRDELVEAYCTQGREITIIQGEPLVGCRAEIHHFVNDFCDWKRVADSGRCGTPGLAVCRALLKAITKG